MSPIRLIDEAGAQVGVVPTAEALERARAADLDLVEVAPTAKPPVCRIMDYGKYKYEQKKKEHKARAQRHETELKQIRIRTPKIGARDLEIKIDHAREFLQRGDRVQFTLRFRGRELAHIDVGQHVLDGVKQALADIAKVDQDFRMERRSLTMTLAPTAKPGGKAPRPKSSPPPAGPSAASPQPDPAGPPG